MSYKEDDYLDEEEVDLNHCIDDTSNENDEDVDIDIPLNRSFFSLDKIYYVSFDGGKNACLITQFMANQVVVGDVSVSYNKLYREASLYVNSWTTFKDIV